MLFQIAYNQNNGKFVNLYNSKLLKILYLL